MAEHMIGIGRRTFHLIGSPNIIPFILFMFTLNNFQLILDTGFPQNRTLYERHEPNQGVYKMFTGHFEMKICMFGCGKCIRGTASLPQKGRITFIGKKFGASEKHMFTQMCQSLQMNGIMKTSNFDV